MLKQIFHTADGSHSIEIPGSHISYHSRHGAIQESQHIFIAAGLMPLMEKQRDISVFEMGFGTGLNALLTAAAAEKYPVKINYETIETDPLDLSVISALNYTDVMQRPDLHRVFMQLHQCDWNSPQPVTPELYIYKRNADITNIVLTSTYDLVYFDAFDPEAQPELWTVAIFRKLFDAMKMGGVLLTYCSKSMVRHAMTEAGFTVEKLAGPKGKREIVRAHKRNFRPTENPFTA